jgi:hypothetical protein
MLFLKISRSIDRLVASAHAPMGKCTKLGRMVVIVRNLGAQAVGALTLAPAFRKLIMQDGAGL